MFKRFRRPLKNYIKYGEWDFDPIEYLVLEDKKLVFIILSKVACTSMKVTIGQNYNIGYEKQSGLDIHRNSLWQREYGRQVLNKDYFFATFVRDPFSRLVSCYKDRVLYSGQNEDFKRYYFDNYPFDIPPNITFEEFVSRIVEIPDYLADRHFKKQTRSIFKPKFKKPDFIGRFESLSDDWRYIAEKYGFAHNLVHLNKSDRYKDKDLKKDYREYFNKKTLDMVYEKYKDDIELLGYVDKYEDLLSFVDGKND